MGATLAGSPSEAARGAETVGTCVSTPEALHTVLLGGSVAIAILWRQIFGREGLVNQVLALFGIVGPSWISTPAYALNTLTVLHIWQFGSAMLIFLAGLKQIPRDLYDAASVDGAGPMSEFSRLMLPMLTPVLFFNLIMGIIGAFKAFTSAYIISNGNGGPLDSTLFYTLYLYQKGFTDFEMGYASAMARVLLAIIAACTALVFRSSRFRVHYETRASFCRSASRRWSRPRSSRSSGHGTTS